jgi:hypothetical protein
MATQAQTQTNTSNLLRRVLQTNSATSTLMGILFILLSGTVASFLGLDAPAVILILGISLVLFAAGVYWVSAQNPMRPQHVLAIFLLDVAWVIGSAIILLTNVIPLTTEGKWAVLIAADAVAVFAALEYYGLRHLKS